MSETALREELRLYRWMWTARQIDDIEREIVGRGEAFFQVSSGGHEASAALAPALQPDDYLHCHYRDKALMVARGVPVAEFFDSLLCNAGGHSAGRQMSAHLSAPAMNVLSLVGPVGNNALQAAGVAQQIKHQPSRPIVLCSLGDGTTQQGEVLEAIAESVRATLPVLFLVQDNRLAISTQTQGQTFYSHPAGEADSFYGLPVHRIDGRDALACRAQFRKLVDTMRETRVPQLCVMAVERLTSHTNADDDTIYRDIDEVIRAREQADPLLRLRSELLARGAEAAQLDALEQAIVSDVRAESERCLDKPAPEAARDARSDVPARLTARASEYRGEASAEAITMAAALRETLHARMAADPRVTLYGEDIEDPKGDVFGITRGLTVAFPGRVRNSALSESTIVGTSIGRALAGGRPVAFLQFADFLPLAFNQIATELASMAWRTQGGWRAPVILMVSCGGYRPGLGPFHAHTFEATVAHVPGVDVVMPSTAADAAGMLNAAFLSERPTLVLYPKALLNDRGRMTSPDVGRQLVPIGSARVIRSGADLSIVAWGNTVPLAERVAAALDAVGVGTEVIDLRWLAPWDRETVCASARKTGRLLVIHEDNLSGGFGAEVLASVAESVTGPVQCRRLARPDTFVPCHFGNQLEVLPSFRSSLQAAADLLELDLQWEMPPAEAAGQRTVDVIGSSPADQTVQVVEIPCHVGQAVRTGQVLASLEADKATVDLTSPAEGVISAIHLQVGDQAAVGAPLLTLAVTRMRQRQPVAEPAAIPHLSRRAGTTARPQPTAGRPVSTVLLSGLGVARGRDRLHNTQLAGRLPMLAASDDQSDGILDRTGIESRLVASADQDAVSMAVEAARLALHEAGIEASALGLVICSTTTPLMISPSTACQVMGRLAPGADIPAYDIQAACSGYLYALANAWDALQQQPDRPVLVLTTETMRRIVDIDDPNTSPIFGDAATASVLVAGPAAAGGLALLQRPVLGARGESGATLNVPLPGGDARVHMDGQRIFSEAIRNMSSLLARACEASQLNLGDLDLVVPHQANGRIIEAMRTRLKLPPERVWNEVRHQGNTSSSSIPLALDTVLRRQDGGLRIGLCAFGAGYTFAGAVLLPAPGPADMPVS